MRLREFCTCKFTGLPGRDRSTFGPPNCHLRDFVAGIEVWTRCPASINMMEGVGKVLHQHASVLGSKLPRTCMVGSLSRLSRNLPSSNQCYQKARCLHWAVFSSGESEHQSSKGAPAEEDAQPSTSQQIDAGLQTAENSSGNEQKCAMLSLHLPSLPWLGNACGHRDLS